MTKTSWKLRGWLAKWSAGVMFTIGGLAWLGDSTLTFKFAEAAEREPAIWLILAKMFLYPAVLVICARVFLARVWYPRCDHCGGRVEQQLGESFLFHCKTCSVTFDTEVKVPRA